MSVPVEPGQILVGKYRVERVLGSGGMGIVVAATHLSLDEPVAIKFLHPEALENPDAVARFAREARAAVKIKSEHVGRVIDVGALETGAPYMVMEYLEGRDLSNVVLSDGPLPIQDAVEYVLQACEAIAHAHVLGIVHRDLKPANLFLTHRADGSPAIKVLDFGISKVTPKRGSPSSSEPAMTRTAAVMGSPVYMSPEQMASSRDVDARTDIWALGAILYELLAGQPPFQAETMPQLCTQILSGTHEPLRTWRPLVPAGLEAVVDRCLQKVPGSRYPNVAELARALADDAPKRALPLVERTERVIASAELTASGAVLPASAGPGASAQTAGAWSGSTSTRRPARLVWIAVVAGAAAVSAIGLWARGRRAPPPPGALVAAATSAPPPAPVAAPIAVPVASVVVSPVTSASAATATTKPVARPASSRPKLAAPAAAATTATSPKPPPSPPVDLLGERK